VMSVTNGGYAMRATVLFGARCDPERAGIIDQGAPVRSGLVGGDGSGGLGTGSSSSLLALDGRAARTCAEMYQLLSMLHPAVNSDLTTD
jgi:hypothetical protein